jgi:hypothetical protein
MTTGDLLFMTDDLLLFATKKLPRLHIASGALISLSGV